METKKYNSYSTDFKLAAISGKNNGGNYSNKYYWNTKGKDKIIQALHNDGHTALADLLLNLNSGLTDALNELFSFIHQLIDRSNKTQKLFKSSRSHIESLWEILKPFVSVGNLCKWFRVSERTYFGWKKRIICQFSYTKECPNVYPNQLRDWERRILENDYFFNDKYADYSVSDLLGQVMADGKVIICESLFYEYAALLGETEKRKVPRKKITYKGLRAEKAKDIIHMDRTKFSIKNNKNAWAYLISDNRSRAVLGFTVNFSSHSRNTLANLKEAITKHNLLDKPFWLVTDDGSENKGEVKIYVKDNPNIKHKIAQLNIPYSNSMIEAVIKQLKYRYLKKKEFDSIEELIEALTIAIEIYNNRPRKIHLGKTPLQVLDSDEVDLAKYAALKKQVRKERIEENQNFSCLKSLYAAIPDLQNTPTAKSASKKSFFAVNF